MQVSEDELTNALIQHHHQKQERAKEVHEDADDVEAYPEAHYNHYGNRGVADLYAITGEWEGFVYELKSEAAVQDATGANQILRQFNKMREYFFAGSQHDPPTHEVNFELCFTPSELNFRHIAENAEMYRSVILQELSDIPTKHVHPLVTIRPPDPDNITPIIMQSPGFDFREPFPESDHTFTRYVEYNQPEIFEAFEDTIRDIASE